MDVKQAVKTAKDWVSEVLGEEGISNVGLEEVKFDEMKDSWLITIGFSRPWNANKNAMALLGGIPSIARSYRVIAVKNSEGTVDYMAKPDFGE